MSWRMPDLDFEVVCHTTIKDSVVVVDCDCNRFDQQKHLVPLFNRIIDIARAPVDLFAYTHATGLSVTFETLTELDTDKTGPILLQDPDLGRVASSLNNLKPQEFYKFLQLYISDHSFLLVLRDLIGILSESYVAPRNSYRAVEGIRHLLSPGEKTANKGWEKLQKTLQIDKSYLDPIRENSIAARHGDPSHVPGSICADVTFRAWAVMDRYIEFRKRGGIEPLNAADFPILR